MPTETIGRARLGGRRWRRETGAGGLPSVYAEDGDGAENPDPDADGRPDRPDVLLRITAMEAYGTVTQSLEVQNRVPCR